MTMEYVTSAKETSTETIRRVFTILNLYLCNSSGCFSLQMQSLLITKINLIAVEMHSTWTVQKWDSSQKSSFTYTITVSVY